MRIVTEAKAGYLPLQRWTEEPWQFREDRSVMIVSGGVPWAWTSVWDTVDSRYRLQRPQVPAALLGGKVQPITF